MYPKQPQPTSSLMRNLLTAFVILTCVRVWLGPVSFIQPARAQTLNPASQRRMLVEEARRTNQLLTEIAKTLKTHTFKVKIEGADKQSGNRPAPPRAAGSTTPKR